MENKSKDKRLEEKLEAEIARSLSVVKMKEAHKQIEDIEKSRKKSAILSINQRIEFNMSLAKSLVKVLMDLKKDFSEASFDSKLRPETVNQSFWGTAIQTYESIRFDLQRNIDLKTEDFERLFPKQSINIDTYNKLAYTLQCLIIQMQDMKAYCLRLL